MTKEELEKYTVDFMNNETSSNGSKLNSVLGKMLIKYAEIFQKCIAELEKDNKVYEKENAKLKEELRKESEIISCDSSCYDNLLEIKDNLTKAKEIIKDLLLMAKVEHLKDRYETVDEAEQFLNEVEK